ncbi:MAG TPA: HAD family phosphatase [Hanamia sp.]
MKRTENTQQININEVIRNFDVKAAIFDLDGTLLDNNSFHLKSWVEYLKDMGRNISEEEFNASFNGRTNKDVIKYIFNHPMNEEEILKYSLEKEAVYRKIYKPYIQPVKGLIAFLEILKNINIPMAIATSGIQPNIDFMFENIPIKSYFNVVVNSSHITHGKPHPEIYLKTASLLNVNPENCLVFEDAIVGIDSAKAAGMKVVAVATTEPKENFHDADFIIDDFTFLLENQPYRD